MWQTINDSISNLCSSPFWDTNVTWNSPDPDFTLCFEKTVLVWFPCLFLWIFLPLEIYYLRHSKAYNIPFNLYNITKLALIVVMGMLALIDTVNYVFFEQEHVSVDVYSSLIKCFTFVLFFLLTYANMKYGIRSSGVLFTFSFMLALSGAPQFRTELRSQSNLFYSMDSLQVKNHNIVDFASYVIHYSLVLIILFLNCFADARPRSRIYPTEENVCPERESSVLSRILFAWFDVLISTGYKRLLTDEDVWKPDYHMKSSYNARKFEQKWSSALERKDSKRGQRGVEDEMVEVSIFRPLCEVVGPYFTIGIIMNVFRESLVFASPLILNAILAFVAHEREYLWHGYVYATALLVVAASQTFLLMHYAHNLFRTGLKVQAALALIVYRKALRISSKVRREFSLGEIVNLVAVDAQQFLFLLVYINLVWSTPLQVVVTTYLLWRILGPSVLAGLAVMIALIPLNGFIVSKAKTFQIKQMEKKDQRVKLLNEILCGIKVLKLYAWEPSFEDQVGKIRDEEIKAIMNAAYLNSATSFIWKCAPFLVTLVTFAVYVLSSEENVLDAQTAFVSLALFNILKPAFERTPMLIGGFVQSKVALKRLNKFLNAEEMDPNAVLHEPRPEPIIVKNGQFSWDGYEGSPTLSHVNLKVQPGNLVAVVGLVGAGKSSLLSALLGDMYKQSGVVNTTGRLAYVPQEAWLLNATFQDNITFGDTSNNAFYEQILQACALNADLNILPAGDRTEIGEKGINLSGGQKQRVSLARAVFSNADTYLLDDPLSAVDAHVGKHIFEQVIGPNGMLKEKTRVWVTHNVTYLPEVDCIFVLRNGSIAEVGTYNELLGKKGDFAEFLATYAKESEKTDSELVETASDILRKRSSPLVVAESRLESQRSNEESEVVGEKLIEPEAAETGGVKWSVYVYYLKAIGVVFATSMFAMSILFQAFSVASNYWLSVWSSDASAVVDGHQDTAKRNLYLCVYALLGLGQAVAEILRSLTLYVGATRAAAKLHRRLLTSFVRWSMRVFDMTPAGRILNRFSHDISVIDKDLPDSVGNVLSDVLSVVFIIFVISYTLPLFLTAVLPMGAIYYLVQKFYLPASRQLQRLTSVSRSPIYSHLGESVSGVQSIRAYGLEDKFIQICQNRIDHNQKNDDANFVANRWLGIRVEMVGNFIVFFSALFATLGKDTLSAGLVGLAITYASQITGILNMLVLNGSVMVTNVVAVERIEEYNSCEQEAPWKRPDDKRVRADWPEKGNVSFVDLQMCYRVGLEPVLKGITFHLKGGEKVGIVGRTGAGKSSLTLSLFRVVEAMSGKILIDNVDISQIGLHTLRSRLTIIPQDPVLFSGTLRMNVDPMEMYTDVNIWKALESAGLKTFVMSLKEGLQYEIAKGGDNLSVGQRQLICLARALLRKTKVLILDEATAAVDLETDHFIQNTIREEFKHCTVLTIAHRLNTVLDYDRILVLDKGQVAEYDSPEVLLNSPQSLLYGMAVDAGLL